MTEQNPFKLPVADPSPVYSFVKAVCIGALAPFFVGYGLLYFCWMLIPAFPVWIDRVVEEWMGICMLLGAVTGLAIWWAHWHRLPKKKMHLRPELTESTKRRGWGGGLELDLESSNLYQRRTDQKA